MAAKGSQRDTVASLRQPTHAQAEVDAAFFERPEHYESRFAIDMSADAVATILGDTDAPGAHRLRQTAKEIEEQARTLDTFREEIGRDSRLDSRERFMERTRIQLKALERLERMVNQTGDFVRQSEAKLREQISETMRTAGNTSMSPTEVRAVMRELPAEERLAFVRQAIDAGDGAVALAVTSAPAYVVGIDSAQLEGLREEAARKFAPEQAQALGALQRGLAALVDQSASALTEFQPDESERAYFERIKAEQAEASARTRALAGGGS